MLLKTDLFWGGGATHIIASPLRKKFAFILKLRDYKEEGYPPLCPSPHPPAIRRSRMPSSRQFNPYFMGDKSIGAGRCCCGQKWHK